MEKAFNRVSYTYLNEAMEALDFGPSFRRAVGLIYDESKPPKRRILANGYYSDWFEVKSVVAPCCPLSRWLERRRLGGAGVRLIGVGVRLGGGSRRQVGGRSAAARWHLVNGSTASRQRLSNGSAAARRRLGGGLAAARRRLDDSSAHVRWKTTAPKSVSMSVKIPARLQRPQERRGPAPRAAPAGPPGLRGAGDRFARRPRRAPLRIEEPAPAEAPPPPRAAASSASFSTRAGTLRFEPLHRRSTI